MKSPLPAPTRPCPPYTGASPIPLRVLAAGGLVAALSAAPAVAAEQHNGGMSATFIAGAALAVAFFCLLLWWRTQRSLYAAGLIIAVAEGARMLGQQADISPSVSLALLACAYAATLTVATPLLELPARSPWLYTFFRINKWGLGIAAAALLTMEPWLHDLMAPLAFWCGAMAVTLVIAALLSALNGGLVKRFIGLAIALAYGLSAWMQLSSLKFESFFAQSFTYLDTEITLLRLLVVGGALLIYALNSISASQPLQHKPTQRSALPPAELSPTNADIGSHQQADRRLAELAGALETQNQMSALMAHELRTPISTISAAAQSLEMILSGSGDVAESRIARIRRAVARMTEMTDQLLSQDRQRNQALTPRHDQVNLGDLARDVVGSIQPDAAHALLLENPNDLVIARCDRSLTSIVLRNLIHNAIKYSPADQPIRIAIGLTDNPSGPSASITVTDQGPGIEQHEQNHIFEPRFRRPAHRETQGMGVGLYLARQICESQGGMLTLHSTAGEGTRFVITLPTINDETHEPAQTPQA